MSVSSINSNTGLSIDPTNPTTTTRTPKQTLDANDFMQLLSVQMQNQDPMKPMDNTEQMAQMAQMGSMQSMAQMALSVSQLNTSQSLTLANSYLGKQVTLLDADGNSVSGQVTAIDGTTTTPQIQVGDSYYPISSITRVELPTAAAATNPAT